MSQDQHLDFERAAARSGSNNLVTDVWYFVRTGRKWWLLPLLATLLLFAALMILSSSAVAPLIYTVF